MAEEKPKSIFDQFRSLTSRQLIPKTQQAIDWYSKTIKSLGGVPSREVILSDTSKDRKIRKSPIYGKMFLFFYDAKTKEDLKYFDRFPIVIPIEPYVHENGSRGFMGLNLHYLPPLLRMKFLDKLHELTNNKKYNSTTKFKLTYEFLSGSAKLKEFKPCLKIYLTKPNHIKSSMLELSYPDWVTVSLLPTEFFVTYKNNGNGRRYSKEKVWADSRSKIK